APVAQFGSDVADDAGDLLHDTGQDADAVAEQAAIGGIVNVRLHHRRVDAHFAAPHYVLFPRNAHGSLVDLLDDLWSERHAPAAHGLGIGHLGKANAGEIAVHEIGAHFPLECSVTPTANVLQYEQT